MSTSQVAVSSQAQRPSPRGMGKRGNRGRGANRGWNRGARPGNRENDASTKYLVAEEEATEQQDTNQTAAEKAVETSESSDAEVCWICAEPVKYYSISECIHWTCHVCALRLRALYKKTDCTFCKAPQPTVVFTTSSEAPFASYTPESTPYRDLKLSILFETQEIMEETLILLRFNCPDPDCDYIGNGWSDLKLHVRASHGKLLCDMCIRHKKVFSHEHTLYPPSILPIHLPSMHQRPNKNISIDQVEGGVHPMCEFCKECFFSSDELYPHMRERHEECFICKRNEVRDQYFLNYDSLEKHFNSVHFPCPQKDCQTRKFVVFNSALDLKAHMVEEHGGEMTARDKKDARRVQAEFAFEEVSYGRQGRRGGDRARDHEQQQRQQQPQPNQQQQQQQQQTSSGPAVNRPSGSGDRRRAAFGGNLTTDNSVHNSSPNTPEPSRPSSPPAGNVDPAVAERHALFLSRLESLVTNPTTAVPAVKAATRGYRASESSARDLISTIWNVLDRNLDHTASVVNAFVDLLDEEEKKQDLLASWKGFAIEQRRQFPELVPSSMGSGYAGIASGRVLNAKHSTTSRFSSKSPRQVWDRVAEVVGSSSQTSSAVGSSLSHLPAPRLSDRFPPLSTQVASSTLAPVPAHRQGQRNTPWSSSSASGFRTPTAVQGSAGSVVDVKGKTISRPAPAVGSANQKPPKLSNSLFPELPSSSSPRQKPQVSGNVSLKNILGKPIAPSVSAWQSNANRDEGPVAPDADTAPVDPSAEGEPVASGTGKGKKGKQKQKQTLFTLGTFPT